jgi:hypothetical protein
VAQEIEVMDPRTKALQEWGFMAVTRAWDLTILALRIIRVLSLIDTEVLQDLNCVVQMAVKEKGGISF